MLSEAETGYNSDFSMYTSSKMVYNTKFINYRLFSKGYSASMNNYNKRLKLADRIIFYTLDIDISVLKQYTKNVILNSKI